MVERKYKCKVPVMLISAATAGQNMESNLPAFAKDYPDWTKERIGLFNDEIEEMSTKIGIKGNREQHEATLHLHRLGDAVIDDATTIKSQIEHGFRKNTVRLNNLKQLLGFTRNWVKAANGNQTAILDLVHTFNNNTDNTVVEELKANGVSENRIKSLKSIARELSVANITQETLKSEAPVITEEMNIRLNEIYDTAIDICAAGKTVFRKDPRKTCLVQLR